MEEASIPLMLDEKQLQQRKNRNVDHIKHPLPFWSEKQGR